MVFYERGRGLMSVPVLEIRGCTIKNSLTISAMEHIFRFLEREFHELSRKKGQQPHLKMAKLLRNFNF